MSEASARVEELESALRTLAGCLPNPIYVYGSCGELWSDQRPDVDEYEEINIAEILKEHKPK